MQNKRLKKFSTKGFPKGGGGGGGPPFGKNSQKIPFFLNESPPYCADDLGFSTFVCGDQQGVHYQSKASILGCHYQVMDNYTQAHDAAPATSQSKLV